MGTQDSKVAVLTVQMSELKDQVQRAEARLVNDISEVKASLHDFINKADDRYASREDLKGVSSTVNWIILSFAGALITIFVFVVEQFIKS